MDGSNTVLNGTASGVVKARTSKFLPPGGRWNGSLLDEARGSELAPNALEEDGGRIGIRAPVLRGRACLTTTDTRQVRRAQLRRNEFERFGYTDSSPGCANARAGCKQAIDHSEQCRSRVDTILSTTTEGQMRLDQAKERFAHYAQAVRQPGEMEPQRKRYRPEGELR